MAVNSANNTSLSGPDPLAQPFRLLGIDPGATALDIEAALARRTEMCIAPETSPGGSLCKSPGPGPALAERTLLSSRRHARSRRSLFHRTTCRRFRRRHTANVGSVCTDLKGQFHCTLRGAPRRVERTAPRLDWRAQLHRSHRHLSGPAGASATSRSASALPGERNRWRERSA